MKREGQGSCCSYCLSPPWHQAPPPCPTQSQTSPASLPGGEAKPHLTLPIPDLPIFVEKRQEKGGGNLTPNFTLGSFQRVPPPLPPPLKASILSPNFKVGLDPEYSVLTVDSQCHQSALPLLGHRSPVLEAAGENREGQVQRREPAGGEAGLVARWGAGSSPASHFGARTDRQIGC